MHSLKEYLRQIGRESEKELNGNEMDNNMTIFNISCIRIVFAGDKKSLFCIFVSEKKVLYKK